MLINVHFANVNRAGLLQSKCDVGSHVCSMSLTLMVLWSKGRYKKKHCYFQQALCFRLFWMRAHPYMAMPNIKFAHMVMCYVSTCMLMLRSTLYIQFRIISIAVGMMFLSERPLSIWDNYHSWSMKCQVWPTYNGHYKSQLVMTVRISAFHTTWKCSSTFVLQHKKSKYLNYNTFTETSVVLRQAEMFDHTLWLNQQSAVKL
jgi:hypothetical protein